MKALTWVEKNGNAEARECQQEFLKEMQLVAATRRACRGNTVALKALTSLLTRMGAEVESWSSQ